MNIQGCDELFYIVYDVAMFTVEDMCLHGLLGRSANKDRDYEQVVP